MFSNEINNALKNINRRALRNNTQRALLALLTSKRGWVARSSMKIPSVGARIRDLRKSEFGSFKIECANQTKAGVTSRVKPSDVKRQTFYRLSPESVTPGKIAKVFGKEILTPTKRATRKAK